MYPISYECALKCFNSCMTRNKTSPGLVHSPQNDMLQILCFVDRASLYNLVNKTNLVHNSLLVLGDYGPNNRRNNCALATLGTCYSVWMTGMQGASCIPDSHPHKITSTKCHINTVVSSDDGPIVAQNM